ncbi:DoxX family membrane protein [Yinghuangia sp. ASG 101]|uniref:TQO small subunit DoxD n=1 Tax=Yinghuangia sp. ASG 101 TaxID=2896848 RepID=UPI001E317C0D|nr:DoxX family protein [Yinghuangia sp. ASG 101]UGQ14885.1 DoxX family membrane protein [Yinghuangia sp. ASG 101]
METRSDGHFGGQRDQDRPTTGGDPGGSGAVPTLLRDAVDPAAVAAPTRSLRVVIGPSGGPLDAQVPGQRVPHGAGRAGPADVTTELPRVRVGGDAPTRVMPRVPESAARRSGGGTRQVRRTAARPVVRSGTRAGAASAAEPVRTEPVRTEPPGGRGGFVQTGMILLPLRLFLGVAFLLEGLRKLYDPAFLDADAQDSFAHRIEVLQGSSFAPSVLDLAAQFAITTGLLFAFGQVVVGVGALLGLWTRATAMVGMLLSLGVLIAVGSASSPYHAAYVVFLAAWSPLALAGAPMYSVDCWLSLRDWRGPLTLPVRARRRKLGYGSIIAGSAVGLTLLAGALFGHPSSPDAPEPKVEAPETSVPVPAPVGDEPPGVPAPGGVPSAAEASASASGGGPTPGSSNSRATGDSGRSPTPKSEAATKGSSKPTGSSRTSSASGGGGEPSAGSTPTMAVKPQAATQKAEASDPTRAASTPLGGLLGG